MQQSVSIVQQVAIRASPALATVDLAAAAPWLRRFAAGPDPPHQQHQQPNAPGSAKPDPPSKDKKLGDVPEHPLLKAHLEQLTRLRGQSRVMEQTMGDALPPWQRWLVAVVGSWVQGWIADFVRGRVEEEFVLQEWLEGAKDAFWAVHQLLADEDYAALRPMLSAKLLSALEATGKEYSSGGLHWRTDLDPDENMEAQLRGLSFWNREQIAEYDAEVAAAGPEEGIELRPGGMWMVLTVHLRTTQRVTITRQSDATVVAKLTDKRPVKWRFATGPLPGKLPTRQLDTPWWLLTIG